MKILNHLGRTGMSIGQICLLLLWLFLGAAATALVLFLLELGAIFFYEIDWWILGAILRITQWVIGVPAAIMFVVSLAISLFYMGKTIVVGRIE